MTAGVVRQSKRLPPELVYGVNVLIATLIFLADLQLPIGVAGGSSHVATVVVAAMWLPGKRPILWFAVAGGVLTLGGLLLSSPPGGVEMWNVFTNRGLALFVIGVTAALGWRWKEAMEARENLEALVAQRTATLSETSAKLQEEVQRRKGTEQSLRDNEERLNLAILGSNDGIWDWLDVSRQELWWSHKFYELLGYQPGELAPTQFTWKQLLHPDDRDATVAAMEALLRGAAPYDVEYRMRTKKGAYRWFRSRGKVFPDKVSGRARAAGTFTDINEKKSATVALLESERRFQSLADSAPVLIWMSGEDKGCTYFNKPWLDLTGRTLDQEMGDGWAEGVHSDDRDRSLATYEKAFDARQKYTMEYRLRRHDGEYCWVLEHGVPRWAPDGEFRGFVGSCVDITERKSTETLYTNAFDSAPVGMVMVDPEGKTTLTNHRFQTMFGYSREELEGQCVEMLMPQVHRARHAEYRESFLRSPEARLMGQGRDLLGLRKDGSQFPVEIGLNPVNGPAARMVLASVIDVSERKATEEKVQETVKKVEEANEIIASRATELRASNEALQEFADAASHDLMEPLRTLISYTTLLREDLGENAPDEAVQDLQFITEAATRMQRHTADLLALSRAGRKELKNEKVDIADCVRESLQQLQATLEQTSAQVKVTDLPTVTADRQSLLQLYQNLLSNAIKFSSKTVQPMVELTAEQAAGEWILGVRDNGIGVDAKHQERIFRPFQRLHGIAEYEGSGLGLAICRKAVERHGGRIWVESEPGKGAHFRFTLGKRKKKSD